MMKQKTCSVVLHITGALEHAADVSLNQVAIKTAGLIKAQFPKHFGTMAQLPIGRNSGCVVVGRTSSIWITEVRTHALRPDTTEPFNCYEHPGRFLSSAGSFSFLR